MRDIYRNYVYKTCLLALTHARNINELRKNTQKSLGYSSRFISHLLHPEEIIIFCGMSESIYKSDGNLKKRKEHVVPLTFIWDFVWDCLKNNTYSDSELAKIISDNLHLAIICEDECQRLDQKPINLKTKMPKGWEFGDDPILRLQAANICLVDKDGNEIKSLLNVESHK